MSTTIQPLGNNVIVKPIEASETTKSGILVPTKEERPEQGEVIAVGQGKRMENGTRQEIEVKIGDKVLFKKYAPNEFEIDGSKVYVLDADDVIAIVK